MRKIIFIILCSVFSIACFVNNSYCAEEYVDGIVAVIGDEIIMLSELKKQLNSQMMVRKLGMDSPRDVLLALRDEVIQGMVDDLLLLEKARRDSIKVDMQQVDIELKNSIYSFNKQFGTESEAQKALEEYGLTQLQFRNMYRDLIINNYLKTSMLMEMQRHISVTPQDIEAWFVAHKDSLPAVPERFKFSHILLYPKVAEERKQKAREKIQGILDRVHNGEDFAELARQYSEDPGNAENGGDLDYFERDEFDKDFSAAAFALHEGEVSDVVETVYGYHIIKVEDIRSNEIRARHILISLIPDEKDGEPIIEKLKEIRNQIVTNKKTFAEMAKEYSEDEDSKDLGGELQWLPTEAGEMIPSFKTEGKKLKAGEISQPFKSKFGYHILKLDDYKPSHILNIKDDRNRIEELIKGKKTLDEYTKIINDLRKGTYIDIRLD